MELSALPIIVICCYLIGEIFKVLFKADKKAYKLIPILLAFIGGILGILIFYTTPNIILTTNIWDSMLVGIISGLSSTGTNQIIKQLVKKDE